MISFTFKVVVFLLCVTSSFATKVVHTDTICKKAKNFSFCSTLLNSKPGVDRDLVSFAQYTIDVVRANVTNSIKLIKTLIVQSGSDAKAREHYKTCLLHFESGVEYRGALDEVVDTQQHLRIRDYYGMAVHASSIMANVDYCILGEYPGDPPYDDKSLLPKYANVVNEVVEIILIIANCLVSV